MRKFIQDNRLIHKLGLILRRALAPSLMAGLLLVCFYSLSAAPAAEKPSPPPANDDWQEEIKKLDALIDALKIGTAEQIQASNDQLRGFQQLLEQLASDVQTLAVSVENRMTQLDGRLKTIQEDNALMKRVESAYSAKLASLEKELDRHFMLFDDHISEVRTSELKYKKEKELLQELLRQHEKSLAEHTSALTETETRLTDVHHNASAAFKNIQQTISRQTLLWIIAILLVTILTILLFLILKIRLSASATAFDRQIQKTGALINAEAVKMDAKLIELLEKQLALSAVKSGSTPDAGEDHALPLKTGLEIHRMRKRIENMPDDAKGVKALQQSLIRLEEEFNAAGYQLINLLGRPYTDGMTVNARFVPAAALEPGEQIITKVIKPQINYRGTLIHAAEVEVSAGE